MQIAVMGAGAVGCFYGAMLAQAGHAVTFIGRKAHVDAINAQGVLLEMKGARSFMPATATTDAAAIAPPDLVLFCVKSADTEAAGRELAPALRPATTILSLQNGVDNAERLGAVLGRPVVPALVYVGAEMAGPGHVRHHGGSNLLIGASPASDGIARLLVAAGIPTEVVADIAVALWSKLVTNCAYNALSAVANIPYGPMLEVAGTGAVIGNVVAECTAVAKACGVTLPDDLAARLVAVPSPMPAQISSTAQDLLRGKPTEIDFLNGHVVRKGAELGIPTPTNLALQVMVKLAETSNALGRRRG